MLFKRNKTITPVEYIASREDAMDRLEVWHELEAVVLESLANAMQENQNEETIGIAAKDVQENFANMDHYAIVELLELNMLNEKFQICPEFVLSDLIQDKNHLDEIAMIYGATVMGEAEYTETEAYYEMVFHPAYGLCPNALVRYLFAEIALARMSLDENGKRAFPIKVTIDLSRLKDEDKTEDEAKAFITICIPSLSSLLVIMDGLHAEIGFAN